MEWKQVDEFPEYSVSDDGLVRNDETDRVITLTRNNSGTIQVGMMKDGTQHKRSVTLLVAKTFLDPPPFLTFNTPINLDGDRSNNSVENLMWRPRWFALKYHRQFHTDARGFNRPVIDLETGEKFKTSWDAAIKYGLIDSEILIATLNNTYVWPTYQRFQTI